MKDDEFLEPSNKARLVLFAFLLLLALIIIPLKGALDSIWPAANASPAELNAAIESLQQMLDYLLLASVCQAILFSSYFVKIARGAIRSGRYPPPGTAVIRRTRVLTGEKAVSSARLSYLYALLMWCLVIVPVYLKWMLNQI